MSGETDLDTLISTMSAKLHDTVFVFATLPTEGLPEELQTQMLFQEAEGITAIMAKTDAEHFGLVGEFPCRMITLEVHSALEAVGFLARITTALAKEGMGVNPVSGFFHDHLFVPEDRAQDAMDALAALAAGTG